MSKKQKFYVVWEGVKPGVYTSWSEAEAQVKGYPEAVFKAFGSLEEAKRAYEDGPLDYVGKKGKSSKAAAPKAARPVFDPLHLPPGVPAEAIAVVVACSGNPGMMEYRGVYLRTGKELFHYGPAFGTNNIGEFLAIVHALAMMDKAGKFLPIYSDSRNALLWLKHKKCKTTLPLNDKSAPVLQLVARAENWLHTHAITTPIMKWETSKWGEIPADFGRKG